MKYQIAVIPGDGIGPEVISQSMRILEAVGTRWGHKFVCVPCLAGGAAIDQSGFPLPKSTVDTCLKSDAVLLGAVGGPKWDALPGDLRPERAILGLRQAMQVFANLRPARIFPQLSAACPLKDAIVSKGLDILIVRELTGGIYFGDRGRGKTDAGEPFAWDTEKYTESEIRRILQIGFESAQKRQGKLCVVDKANVLESSRLWRETAESLKGAYPKVLLSYMYVDNAAMQLVRNPGQFDVLATSNMFGDILSDEASQITGSIGMLSSASLGEAGRPGLYEPIHGSAPDLAGTDRANPLATILSVAMLLRYSLNLGAEADAVEKAVEAALDAGYRTVDIAGAEEGALRAAGKLAGSKRMGGEVLAALVREA
jgi:3-isopropylmalate dehydrogenase